MYFSKLILKGTNKDYKIKFSKGLNIIAGPIYTGKSTILKLIDYCLGKNNHPEYKELRKVSILLLELIIKDECITIERQLFATNKKIVIHYCPIKDLNNIHRKTEVNPSQVIGKESISSFMMKKLNLWGIPLKESIVSKSSGIDIMSFRDLMWFCYLDQNRIDDEKYFLFENNRIKNIKFIQVFKVIFGIHDNKEATLSDQLKEKKREEYDLSNKLDILIEFLRTNRIPDKDNLIKIKNKSRNDLKAAESKYTKMTEDHQELIKFSEIFRKDLQELEKKINNENYELRNKQILKEKLMVLLGQYSEDIRRIEALIEAKNILNPLNIMICPICLQNINGSDNSELCELCNVPLPKFDSNQFDNPTTELARLKKKHKELLEVISEFEIEIKHLEVDIQSDNKAFSIKSLELEKRIESIISPLTTLREQRYSDIKEFKLKIEDIEEKIRYYEIIEDYQKEFGRINMQINDLEKDIQNLRKKVVKPFEDILKSFTDYFYETLENFNFPKLDDKVNISNDLTPYVRDTRYQSQGSLGATVLITQAWYIAFFKLLSNYENPHPKFFLVDSPQSNIGLNTEDDDYKDDMIVNGIYTEYHKLIDDDIIEQLIIVDNTPPKGYDNFYCIKFTRDPKNPPYGLIDDEISID